MCTVLSTVLITITFYNIFFFCNMLFKKQSTVGQTKSLKKKNQVRANCCRTKSLETILTPRNFVENVQLLMADGGDLA